MLLPMFIGTTELILIAGMALLLLGGKKLPEMMRGLGKGMNEFKKGMNEQDTPEANNVTEEPTQTTDEAKEEDSQ